MMWILFSPAIYLFIGFYVGLIDIDNHYRVKECLDQNVYLSEKEACNTSFYKRMHVALIIMPFYLNGSELGRKIRDWF